MNQGSKIYIIEFLTRVMVSLFENTGPVGFTSCPTVRDINKSSEQSLVS